MKSISTPQKIKLVFTKIFLTGFFILTTVSITRAQSNLNCTSTISSNFNGTEIPSGKYIWFNAHFNVAGVVNGTVITINGQTITSPNFNLTLPSATVTFSSSTSTPNYTFTGGTWNIHIPLAGSDEIFFGGLSYLSPGLPGGINPVDWKATFNSSTPGVSLNWQWAAAVYNTFSTDYNSLNVLLTHSSDHAGTPEAFAYAGNVNGGARGGAGSNYTGSWSSTQTVAPCNPSGGPLAALMANFQGTYTPSGASLIWNSLNETNINSFDIERSSDGVIFDPIKSIKATGNSSGNQYEFLDRLVLAGINYYRLKINSTSNTFTYSNVIAINAIIKGTTINSLYPNPFRDQLKVSISSENVEPISIRIIDNSGRVIKLMNNISIQKGSNEVLVNDLDGLQPGLYIVEVNTPFTSLRTKISK